MKPRKKKVLPAVANFYCPAPKKEAKAQDRQRSLTLPMAVLCFFATFSVALPTHPLAGAATVCCFGLSSSFVDSILSTRFCRLWFVDSILSTRFCRLIQNSPLCRSSVLGKAIAMPKPAARPNCEASKFFRKLCFAALRIIHEKMFEV